MIPTRAPAPTAVFLCLLWVASAGASDGVLEINHACALNTGCFSSDAPGYPVLIALPGSYRLTSNLETGGADGIVIGSGVKVVTIDLNGFQIDGGGTGSGIGIRGQPNASAITVRNGTIQAMGGDGIDIGGSAVIESVQALGNGGHGIDVNQTSIVRNGRIVGNGGWGILFSTQDSLYSGNVIANNTVGAVGNGRSGGTNLCGDDTCAGPQLRRYYLTTDTYDGDAADGPAVCADGFHFASLWEILDPSNLEYAEDLGLVRGDMGGGPPAGLPAVDGAYGWVRTGYDPAVAEQPGVANCNDWDSALMTHYGSIAWLVEFWDTGQSGGLAVGPGNGPWASQAAICINDNSVWCVQD